MKGNRVLLFLVVIAAWILAAETVYAAYPASGSLSWSTFLGGVSQDFSWGGIAVDSSGCCYVMGKTESSGFPVTSGAYDTTFSGDSERFVTKFSADGSSLVYSTFIGSNPGDWKLAVDSSGCAYLAGSSGVTKLNSSGSGLAYVYDDLIGAYCFAIAVDSSGCAYVAGNVGSEDFPVTSGAYMEEPDAGIGIGGENYCFFVSKINSSGSGLVYSTFLGTVRDECQSINDIAVDSSGCAYVTGYAEYGYPTTSGAYKTTKGQYDVEGFVTKFNAAGSGLVYSTWVEDVLHDSMDDDGGGIAVDSSGCAYVSMNTYQNYRDEAVIWGFNAAGSGTVFHCPLVYAKIFDLGITPGDTIFVTGWTASANFGIVGSGVYDDSYNGGKDAFLAMPRDDGDGYLYSTFLGGSGTDWGCGIAVAGGSVYVTGRTTSSGFPATSGAYDTSHNGDFDLFLTKFAFKYNLDSAPPLPYGSGSVSVNPGKTYYDYGDEIEVTATANPGYTFDHWYTYEHNEEKELGSANPLTIVFDGNEFFGAHFTQDDYTLTTSVSPEAQGQTVFKSPDQAHYHYGDVVTLTASPNEDYVFSYWSGDLGGNQNPKAITITGNASVTANFTYYTGCR